MKDHITPEMFKSLEIPRKELPESMLNKYRIYTDQTKYTVIEAENAEAAFKACGLEKPLRIVREGVVLDNILPFVKALEEKKIIAPPVEAEMAEVAVAEPVAAEPVEAAIAAPAEESAAPLSSDDVNKLLQG